MPLLLLYEIMVKGVPLFIANKDIYLEKQILQSNYLRMSLFKKIAGFIIKDKLGKIEKCHPKFQKKVEKIFEGMQTTYAQQNSLEPPASGRKPCLKFEVRQVEGWLEASIEYHQLFAAQF